MKSPTQRKIAALKPLEKRYTVALTKYRLPRLMFL